MTYAKVRWKHSHPDQAVLIYHELDNHRWELRKVEIFPDGTVDYANSQKDDGKTGLSETPIPPYEEIAEDPQFEPTIISKAEFESIWAKATGK